MSKPVIVNIRFPFMSRRPSFITDEVTEGRDSKLLARYMLALALEMKANAEEFSDCEIQAVRLDGGSASIVNGSDTEKLLRYLEKAYKTVENLPVSMLTCPADINGANMPFYNRAKITRYDLEMYSLEPQDFATLDTLNFMDWIPYISNGFLHAARTNSMGFVLLYGKKNVSKYGFRHSVLETIRRPVSHVILRRCQGDDAMSDDEVKEQLEMAAGKFSEAGYVEYLPQTWAKPGMEDRFLKAKAEGADMIGFGLGAQTRIDGVTSTNTTDLEKYLEHSGEFELITESVSTNNA